MIGEYEEVCGHIKGANGNSTACALNMATIVKRETQKRILFVFLININTQNL